jgi:starch synthase
MKIAFCSSEVFPFAKTGGLGEVCGTLPAALKEIGIDVTVIMPRYRCVQNSGRPVGETAEGVSTATLDEGITVYFIESKLFFDRDGLYGDAHGDYPDNAQRFQYYCLQTLELLRRFNRKVDIIHCHDWHAALIPVYLKAYYSDDPFYAKTKSVLTIHNLAHQGVFPDKDYGKLGLRNDLFETFEFFGKANFLKAGLLHCDRITTVSPQYAREIQTPRFGCGLEGVLRSRAGKMTGILNGLNYEVWNPSTDTFLEERYSADDFETAKAANKAHLQKEFRLPVRSDIPLCGFVGRLSHQKGIDLILKVLQEMKDRERQVLILGEGDGKYQRHLQEIAARHPQEIAVCIHFDERLAHRIYAGCDFLWMPSHFEPCGLSQMISLRYATIPVVHHVGGLVDTVTPFDPLHQTGNGFVFDKYSREDFENALHKAAVVFHDKKLFRRIRHNALAVDFSWDKSAREYEKVYQCSLSD